MSLCCINRAGTSLLCSAMTTLSCVPKEKDPLPVLPRISNMTTSSQVPRCGLIDTRPSHTVLNTSRVLTALSRNNVSASALWCSDVPSLTGRLLSFPALAREQARRLPVNAAGCSARRAQGRVGAVILPGQVHSVGGGRSNSLPSPLGLTVALTHWGKIHDYVVMQLSGAKRRHWNKRPPGP